PSLPGCELAHRQRRDEACRAKPRQGSGGRRAVLACRHHLRTTRPKRGRSAKGRSSMIRTAAAFLALLLSISTGFSQGAAPDNQNGRFSFNQVAEGLLRLDLRTGQVSLCSKREAGWACQVMPDERAVLESDIARLQGENAALKKEMIG